MSEKEIWFVKFNKIFLYYIMYRLILFLYYCFNRCQSTANLQGGLPPRHLGLIFLLCIPSTLDVITLLEYSSLEKNTTLRNEVQQ